MSASLLVRHNIEVAHRLSLLPGKCEAIHGHSMWVELELTGVVDDRGLLAGLDFGGVKRAFRGYLDTEFDHRLLLNASDPLADLAFGPGRLPGLRVCPGDPSTENIAAWVGRWALEVFGAETTGGSVVVQETHVNAATYRWEGTP